MKYTLLTITLFLFIVFSLKAQVYKSPIAAKQSHADLEIIQIERTAENTIVNLKVTNKRDAGGWFCASKSIIIKNSEGLEQYDLIKSENIPICPEKFEFSYVGQTLEFTLYFPPIPSDFQFIDIIENCADACFYFNHIILNNEHNDKIKTFEQAFELYQSNQYIEAIPLFESVISTTTGIDSQIYGLSYYYLIKANQTLKQNDKAAYWIEELKKADVPDKQTILKELGI